jgi:SnoaL-like protein
MSDSRTLIRNAYDLAAAKDIPGWVNAFTQDGTFTDMSTGVTYRSETLGDLVEIHATAFSDMRRELYRFYTSNDFVVVQLALQGTHDGPLVLPTGIIPPTGRRIDAPCCDVVELICRVVCQVGRVGRVRWAGVWGGRESGASGSVSALPV